MIQLPCPAPYVVHHSEEGVDLRFFIREAGRKGSATGILLVSAYLAHDPRMDYVSCNAGDFGIKHINRTGALQLMIWFLDQTKGIRMQQ